MSATSEPNGEIHRLFRKHIPEIEDGTVEIVSMARDAGRRTCMAVRSHNPKLNAVQTCSGERGIRLRAMATEFGGEHFTVIHWHASTEQLIQDALFDLTSHVVTDSATRRAIVTVDRTVNKFGVGGKADPQDSIGQEVVALVARMTG
jgi:transcription termination/antitermination protein NusA